MPDWAAGIFQELSHLNKANQERSKGNLALAKQHEDLARLAANRERNRLCKIIGERPEKSAGTQNEDPGSI